MPHLDYGPFSNEEQWDEGSEWCPGRFLRFLIAPKPGLKLSWPLARPTMLVLGAHSLTPRPSHTGRRLHRVCFGSWETVVLPRVDFLFVIEEASFLSS